MAATRPEARHRVPRSPRLLTVTSGNHPTSIGAPKRIYRKKDLFRAQTLKRTFFYIDSLPDT